MPRMRDREYRPGIVRKGYILVVLHMKVGAMRVRRFVLAAMFILALQLGVDVLSGSAVGELLTRQEVGRAFSLALVIGFFMSGRSYDDEWQRFKDMFGGLFARRRTPGLDDPTPRELLAEIEAVRQELQDIQERLDFSERQLAEVRRDGLSQLPTQPRAPTPV
jgi:hypothetical protein